MSGVPKYIDAMPFSLVYVPHVQNELSRSCQSQITLTDLAHCGLTRCSKNKQEER